LNADFGHGVSLLGFHSNKASVTPGEAFQFTYYWTLAAETDIDFWVDILFTDEEGNVTTKAGFPTWLQSHWLGSGAYPTSEWKSGEIVMETYYGLVPRGVQPGRYYIRAFLYQGGPRQDPVSVAGGLLPEEGLLLGIMQVEDR